MNWKPFHGRDKTFDLSHLNEFSFDYVVAAKADKPAQIYKIDVAFSLHCFTNKVLTETGEWPRELEYSDGREVRLFDEERWEVSKQLPNLIRGISKCYHAADGNFFLIEKIVNGKPVSYYVFFKVSRSSRGSLNLFVNTAYVPDIIPKKQPPINFSVIAFNTWNGERIKRPD